MRSIITPEGTPDWAYEELRDIIGVPSWLEFDKHQNIIIDIDETGRTTRLVYKYINGQLEAFIRHQFEQKNNERKNK